MIETDKIMRTTKILLHGRHITESEADDVLGLIAEVKRLEKVARKLAKELLEMDAEGAIELDTWPSARALIKAVTE